MLYLSLRIGIHLDKIQTSLKTLYLERKPIVEINTKNKTALIFSMVEKITQTQFNFHTFAQN
ncbi:MAG: hypothetical protein Tsb0033_00810 [Winogradskyella sp.]